MPLLQRLSCSFSCSIGQSGFKTVLSPPTGRTTPRSWPLMPWTSLLRRHKCPGPVSFVMQGPRSTQSCRSNCRGLAAKARIACGGRAERFSPSRMARACRMSEGAFHLGCMAPLCRSSAPAAARAGLRSARQARSKQRADPQRSATASSR